MNLPHVKIFVGSIEDVQKQIDDFLSKLPQDTDLGPILQSYGETWNQSKWVLRDTQRNKNSATQIGAIALIKRIYVRYADERLCFLP